MNIETGEIVEKKYLTEEQMKSGKFVPMNEEVANKLKRMNRAGRRKYYATHKREFETV